jgi:hypothetical protein
MSEARNLLNSQMSWLSCFDMRPSSLFEGVAQRLCVVLTSERTTQQGELYTAGYRRWAADERPSLMPTTTYTELCQYDTDAIPKLSSDVEKSLLQKIRGTLLSHMVNKTSKPIYVHRIVRYFIKSLDFIPLFIDAQGQQGKSEDYKEFRFIDDEQRSIVALLNSSLFYWFWRAHSDGFHCGYGDVFLMPYRRPMDEKIRTHLLTLQRQLMQALQDTSTEKSIKTKAGVIRYQEFTVKSTKPIIDEIDRALAQHYGFTAEELDFIINYDIKYRMGRDGGAGE